MTALEQGVHHIHILIKGEHNPNNSKCDHVDNYQVEFFSRGLQALVVPILQFTYSNLEELSRSLADIRSSQLQDPSRSSANLKAGLILTSPRAVDAVAEAIKLSNIASFTSLLDTDFVFVVGKTTANECVSKLSIDYNKQSIESGSGAELFKYIKNCCLQSDCPIHFIYPKSSLAENNFEDLPKIAPQVSLTSIVTYETKIAPDFPIRLSTELSKLTIPCDKKVVNINLIFFSPSSVQGWARFDRDEIKRMLQTFNGRQFEFSYSSIGKTTEATLVQNNFEVYCVAEKPSAISLVGSILNRRRLNSR